jgi:hypothetical protein
MAINKGEIPFIGNRGGLYGYWQSGINIIRVSPSLSRAKVKKDSAFKSFRQNSKRMKEASPIAASLYNQIPDIFTINSSTGPNQGNNSSRTESFLSRIKSRSSPVDIGLDLDLVAY